MRNQCPATSIHWQAAPGQFTVPLVDRALARLLLRKNTVAVRSVHRSASSSLIVAAERQQPNPTFASACGRRCLNKATCRSSGPAGPPRGCRGGHEERWQDTFHSYGVPAAGSGG